MGAAKLEVGNIGAAAANSRSARGASAYYVERGNPAHERRTRPAELEVSNVDAAAANSMHERRIKPPSLEHGTWLTSSTMGAPRSTVKAAVSAVNVGVVAADRTGAARLA
jgi:uncharacterized iron-regulated membrane protein